MTLIDLGAWLRNHRDDAAQLTLHRAAVRALQDELNRLQQSNDRMRKQNRKLRRKHAAGDESGPPDAEQD